MSVWTGEQVAEYVGKEAPIKINPNGVDIGVSEIWRISDEAKIIINGKQRESSPEKELVQLEGDFYNLKRGVYEIRFSNSFRVPINAACLLFPRSTFNRFGIIASNNGVGDSGYNGFCTRTIFVPIKEAKIHKDELWTQIIFISNKDLPKQLYEGHWQNEKPRD